ncbi:hypothetical protein ABBQ38_001709 [Trebouxia sp. C0009 RCD-2024]
MICRFPLRSHTAVTLLSSPGTGTMSAAGVLAFTSKVPCQNLYSRVNVHAERALQLVSRHNRSQWLKSAAGGQHYGLPRFCGHATFKPTGQFGAQGTPWSEQSERPGRSSACCAGQKANKASQLLFTLKTL